MRHYIAPLLTITLMTAAVLGAALVHELRPAQAAAPPQILHARISVPSVPPDPAPPTLVAAEGFDGLASLGGGVYTVALAGGLAFTDSAALMCAGTKPGVTCAVELVEPAAGWPCTNVIIYRERWGQPEDGDVWVWALP